MSEKIWTKFHALFGSDLKVGFETTFPKSADLNLDPLYGKSGLVHEPPNETIKRVYEPAVKIFGSCLDGDAAQVLFEPALSESSLFRRLVFTRKIDHSTGKVRRQIVAARRGEIATFGFDSWNSKNQRYLSLAYPGLSKQFIPVYFKVQDGENFVYLEMWAFDEGRGRHVTAQARRIRETEAPESLKNFGGVL